MSETKGAKQYCNLATPFCYKIESTKITTKNEDYQSTQEII